MNRDLDVPGALIDWDRSVCLCDAGAPGYVVAVCVTRSGDDVLWIVNADELDADNPRTGNADQPHEQTGPLPLDYVRRLTIATRQGHQRGHRCGRRTRSGTVCRSRVTDPGTACQWHTTERTTEK